MSRQPRAGKAGKPTTFRSTAAERAHWKRAARAAGHRTLSAWAITALNAQAERDAPRARRTRTTTPPAPAPQVS